MLITNKMPKRLSIYRKYSDIMRFETIMYFLDKNVQWAKITHRVFNNIFCVYSVWVFVPTSRIM